MKKRGITAVVEESDTYTGRQKELDLFFDTLENKVWDENKILSYYGVGGIGKTGLRKELMKKLESESLADFTYINFETKELQQVEKALVYLRTEIGKKYRVPFTLFDVAYILYMNKTNNAVSINEKSLPFIEKALPFIEKGTWLADVVNIFTDNSYVSLATKLIDTISKRLVNHLSKEDKAIIHKFETYEEHKLLEELPFIFAADLEKYLLKSENKFVIFIDTYEALWTDQRMKAYDFGVDEWVRDLVGELPNVLWVVFGREPVDWDRFDEEWDEYITKVQLGSLSEIETKELLRKHQIFDAAIQEEIYRNSGGHPYSIKLSYDTYTKIARTRQPIVSDFIGLKTPAKLFNRFIKYLLVSEKQALELLALTNGWDIETYEALMIHFRIQMNEDDHYNLTRFSFISELDETTWEMHQLMRESLVDHQSAEKVVKGRAYLFDYFKAKLSKDLVRNDPHQAGKIINQAFYHGFMLMEQQKITLPSFIDWFREYDFVFLKSKANYLTLPLLKQLKYYLGESSQSEAEKYLGIILYDIAYVYMDENREYEKAEPLFKEALELRERKFPEDKLSIAKSNYGLATLYQRMGRNQEAEELHLMAFSLREQYCDQSNLMGLAFSSNGLALLYQNLKDYEKALQYYGKSLEIYEKLNKSDYANIATSMMNLISCYHELHQYDKAYEFSIKVRDIVENDENFNQINYAKALNVVAVTKTAFSQFDDALELFQNSYDIFKSRLGEESLEVSKVLHNLAITYKLLKNDTESIDKMTKCLEIKNKMVSMDTLKEATLTYRSSLEMNQLLQQELFEYDDLKFNF